MAQANQAAGCGACTDALRHLLSEPSIVQGALPLLAIALIAVRLGE